jgi:hypothetical protein
VSVTVHPVLATTAEPRRRCRTCRYEYVGADAIAVGFGRREKCARSFAHGRGARRHGTRRVTQFPSLGRAGHLETGAPKGTTPVTVLDVLVALVSVAALIGGGPYLDHATHLAPPPGDPALSDTPTT